MVSAVYFTLVERWVETRNPLEPIICSIYDRRFWVHERLWKVHPIHYLHAFDATPFKNALWRLRSIESRR